MRFFVQAPAVLRGVVRTLFVVLVTGAAVLVAGSAKPFRRWPRIYYPWRNLGYRIWTWGLCTGWNLRVRFEGTPPEGSFFLVCNHLSYLDVAVLGRHLHTTFVAKADLDSWPVLGFAFRTGDTIFIDRGRKRDLLRVMEQVEGYLADGLGVILFPEGTSSRGRTILPFKPSLLQIAARHEIPVHWATLRYEVPEGEGPPSHTAAWWGDEAFLPHYGRMIRVSRIDAVVRFGEEPVHSPDRKELADTLRRRMLRAFEPME